MRAEYIVYEVTDPITHLHNQVHFSDKGEKGISGSGLSSIHCGNSSVIAERLSERQLILQRSQLAFLYVIVITRPGGMWLVYKPDGDGL